MSKTKQFWALLKFGAAVNPFIWFMPVAFGTPLIFGGAFSASYHPSLSVLLPIQNLFFVGFLGMWALAPEMAQPWGSNAGWSSGTEFLLTRAIDRPVFYRSRACLLYILILLVPLVTLIRSLQHPDLELNEYSKLTQQECLSHVPGSALEPDSHGSRSPLIAVPRGNVLVEEWHFWMFSAAALGVQVLLLFLHRLKHGILIFYALFMSAIFIPLFVNLHQIHEEAPSYMERLFFSFTAHQVPFWILTVVVMVLGQLWCERRFARLEQ